MFGIDTTIIAFVGLLTLGVVGLVYALMFDRISAESKQSKRIEYINDRDAVKGSKAAARVNDVAKRRQTVQDSLKELEENKKQKRDKKYGLKQTIRQAGLKITVRQFYIMSFVFGILATLVTLLAGKGMLVAGGVFVVATFGIPRWVVGFIRKRRFNSFLTEFPNAVDIIVRGVRAGLPLNDCLMIISKEAKEPIKGEFARIIEAQQMGLPMNEAITKLYDSMPLAEANFFGIVITIQQSAGGNLSEALGNLSNVLRDRKKMKAKIQAMSAEAKASGGIIGSLPFIVGGLVYLTTPEYIKVLFEHPTGNLVLLCAGIWMSIGIMVMRSMINFDF